jgi:hypothetical protein
MEIVNSKRQTAFVQRVPVIIPSKCHRRLCLFGLEEVIIKRGALHVGGGVYLALAEKANVSLASVKV